MKLHFSIRDLLWLTLMVGLLLAWWMDHQRNTRFRIELIGADIVEVKDTHSGVFFMGVGPTGFADLPDAAPK